jgi:hypothetical protein
VEGGSVLCAELQKQLGALAARRHPTRFGVFTDCPIENLVRRDAYDRRHATMATSAAPVAALPAPAPRAGADNGARQLRVLRERLKLHDDRNAPTYDEDHARKLRAEIHQLERTLK